MNVLVINAGSSSLKYQLLNPTTGDLDERLLESIGLKREQFGTLTHPGTIIGTINEAVQKEFSAVRDRFRLSYTFPWD